MSQDWLNTNLVDDTKLARSPRKAISLPTVISVQPAGTMYQPGQHVGPSNTGPRHVAIRPTMAAPPAPGTSNDDYHWSEGAAVVDVAQTPHP